MLTRMTEEDWATVLEVFRACRSRRGAKGRNDRLFLEALHYFCRPQHHLARSARGIRKLEFRLDGRFTNDKFCFVRHGQLALSWRRAPFGSDGRPATAEASAPEGSRPRGVDHEPASLDGHALLDQPSERAQALGQSLSAAPRRGWTTNNRGPRRRRSEASARGEPPCR